MSFHTQNDTTSGRSGRYQTVRGSTVRGGTVRGNTVRGTTVQGTTVTVAMVRGVLWWRRTKKFLAWLWQRILATITAAGWLVIFTLTLGLSFGLLFGWIEAVGAALVALFLTVFALPFLFGAKSYEVRFELSHDRIVAGQDVEASIAVQNVAKRAALAGMVDLPLGEGLIEVQVPFLRSGSNYEETILIPGQPRGVLTVGPARTVRSDPLRLFKRERSWQDKQTLYIHPQTAVLPATSTGFMRDLEGNPDKQIVNDDLSFHAIREYQAGDSRRHVHWKSTAKTGQLMVRQYEETKRSQMLVILDPGIASYRDEQEFELAVSAAASLGVRGIRDGRDVRVVLGREVPEFAVRQIAGLDELNTRSARNLLDEFAALKHISHVTPLGTAAALSAERFSGLSIAFLISGSATTAPQLRSAALAFPSNVAVLGVVCNSQAEPGFRRLGDINVVSIGLVDDLRQLLLRGA